MNRFTEQVRDTLHEAHAVADDFVGTEHLLIALACSSGVAKTALTQVGLTAAGLEAAISPGAGGPTGTIPFSPGAKHAIEVAAAEALSYDHEDIGTAHLLLGLLSGQTTAALQVVEDAGVNRAHLRRAIDALLKAGASDSN